MDRPQLTSALDPPRAVYRSIAGVAGGRVSHAGNVPTTALAWHMTSRDPIGEVLCARACVGTFPACEKRSPATPAIAPYTARGGSEPDVNCGRSQHRFLTAAWEELDHELRHAMPNAQKHPTWEIYDQLAGSRDGSRGSARHGDGFKRRLLY